MPRKVFVTTLWCADQYLCYCVEGKFIPSTTWWRHSATFKHRWSRAGETDTALESSSHVTTAEIFGWIFFEWSLRSLIPPLLSVITNTFFQISLTGSSMMLPPAVCTQHVGVIISNHWVVNIFSSGTFILFCHALSAEEDKYAKSKSNWILQYLISSFCFES